MKINLITLTYILILLIVVGIPLSLITLNFIEQRAIQGHMPCFYYETMGYQFAMNTSDVRDKLYNCPKEGIEKQEGDKNA